MELVSYCRFCDFQVYHCNNCDHDNEDLSEDEDGDLVCEECGHVIDPPPPKGKSQEGTVHTCLQCGHENNDLELDEDGDLVCQECGHVIPEQDGEEVRAIEGIRERKYVAIPLSRGMFLSRFFFLILFRFA